MKKGSIILLGLGHGLNDLVAGYFLGLFIYFKSNTYQVGLALLLYNLLAFGGQWAVALLLERYRDPRKFLLLSYVLNLAAVALFNFIPHISIVFAGIASAIYHVAGGTICAKDNKAGAIGLFAAPGVVGLIAGGYFAWINADIFLVLNLAVFLFLLFLYFLPLQSAPDPETNDIQSRPSFALDRHDLIMILLLIIISMRSVIWNIFQLMYENNYEWLLAIAASAFVGKIVGGWLADKIGCRLYIFISLVPAMPLVTFFKDELLLFCIGIGLLQSGIPATTTLLINSMKGKAERGVALSFGTAIMIGVILMYTPLRFLLTSDISLITLILLMIFLLSRAKLHSIKSGKIF